MGREDEIRLIAYHIWEEESCPNGLDCEHWFIAEAIWEQKQKTAANSAKIESKQTVKQNAKVMSAKKRSQSN